METTVPENSPLKVVFHIENWITGSALAPELYNTIRYINETNEIVLLWDLPMVCSANDEVVIENTLSTTFKIVSVTDYDSDLPSIKVIVLDSCSYFSEELKRHTGSAPAMEVKIEEISLRILETLTDQGYY